MESLEEKRWRWLSAAMPYIVDSLLQGETVYFPSCKNACCEFSLLFESKICDEDFMIEFTELFGGILSLPIEVFAFFRERMDLMTLFLSVFVDYLKYTGYFRDLETIARHGKLEDTDFEIVDAVYSDQLKRIVAILDEMERVIFDRLN
jgi:hypothetical protein